MDFHYNKHYKGYINKLNELITKPTPLADLVKNAKQLDDKVRFNAGGAYNHLIFFNTIKKNTKPSDLCMDLIETFFKSQQKFETEFSEKALSIMGSGWCWLVIKKGKAEIVTTANQDNPLMFNQGTPLFGIDMWEHAYYEFLGPNKQKWVNNFFKIINWDAINQLLIVV